MRFSKRDLIARRARGATHRDECPATLSRAPSATDGYRDSMVLDGMDR